MSKRVMHHVCIQTEKYEEFLGFIGIFWNLMLLRRLRDFTVGIIILELKLDDFMIELQTPKKGDTLNKWSSLNEGIVHMCFLVNDIEEEYNRIISLGYNNFKVKNGEIIYNVEGGKLFKVKAPEGTEVEIRDTNI